MKAFELYEGNYLIIQNKVIIHYMNSKCRERSLQEMVRALMSRKEAKASKRKKSTNSTVIRINIFFKVKEKLAEYKSHIINHHKS